MDSNKKRTLNVVAAVGAIVAGLAGLVLSGLLNAFNDNGNPVSFVSELMYVIQVFQNLGSFDASKLMALILSTLTVLIFVITFVMGLALIVKLIIDVVNIKKEGYDKKAVSDSFKLSYTLLVFFGMIIFFTYYKAVDEYRVPALGAYLGLGAGALAVCFSTFNYLITSEKPLANKLLRSCLLAVGFAASVSALMPTIVYGDIAMAPGFLFLLTLKGSMSGGMSPGALTGFLFDVAMLVLLVIASSFANANGNKAVKENNKKNKQLIVLSAVALVLSAVAFFVVPLIEKSITLSLFAYITLGLLGLMLVLAIILTAVSKNEQAAPQAQAAPQNAEAEPAQEEAPAEEQKEEEQKQEDAQEVAEAVVVADAVAEEEEKEEPAQEEQQAEEAEPEQEEAPEEEEQPAEAEEKKEPAKKPAAKKAEPKAEEKKPAAKKAAPAKEEKKEAPKAAKPEEKKPAAKKAEAKDEDAPKKNNASYHLSKRASDNKWQVFRAGSDKVIKLFDTKAEAEEYTKRMAENQGVSYLSHASKGKNKGRIQKK